MEMVFAILMLFMFGLGAAVGHRENQPDPKAMRDCQALGYSAGHYEKEAGLVCEQWIEAAKVDRFPRKEATR